MNIRRVRVDTVEPVVTAVAVCFVPAEGVFVLRYTVRWRDNDGLLHFQAFRIPLTYRDLIEGFGGSEFADWLVQQPGTWWRVPDLRGEEGYVA